MRSALEDALQFVETLHSTVSGDSRKIVWRCLERGRAALAARQPVGEPVVVAHRYIQRHQSAEHSVWLNGDADETYVEAERQGLGRIERAYSAPPAQAVDLTYSLDADPAGIRARVCDVITGTLMVGAQGHTPPPAGHWAEPFWKAARADAPAQAADLGGLREMLESWKNSDYPFSYEGQCAQRALDACVADLQGWLDSQAVGNG